MARKSTNLGRNVEIPPISIGHELLHTMVGILAAGLRQNLVEDSMYWIGNSSAHRNFDTTITSVFSDNSSVAPICCGHPPEGPVTTLSGRLARKLQRSARWSMLVFQNKFKRCWMRRPLVDVILSRSAVLMFLA